MKFLDAIAAPYKMLAEGSMYDRLKRIAGSHFDPDLEYLGLIYSAEGQAALQKVYRDYFACASRHRLPLMILTPTWRANAERIARSRYADTNPNNDSVSFVKKLCREAAEAGSPPIFVAGLIGCKHDCYRPEDALTSEIAAEFHAPQIAALAESGVDLLFASTLPSVREAIGMAQPMSRTSLPYMLSFVVDKNGRTLDGMSFPEAVAAVDLATEPRPAGYAINCVHPAILLEGLQSLSVDLSALRGRFIGFQGNTSKRDPREFDSLSQLETETPREFAQSTVTLAEKFGLKILGGCCGTGPEHIAAIGELIRR